MTISKTKIITLLIFSGCALFADLSVNVDRAHPDANPQIFVNGSPVRPRMFWGSERSGGFEIDQQWKEIVFEVTVPFDANATLHFRFGKSPGDIWLKDLEVKNTETGQLVFPEHTLTNETIFANNWNVYPPDERNTVGVLSFKDSSIHINLNDPPAGDIWPDFHVYSDYVNTPEGKTYRYACLAKASEPRTIFPAVYHVSNGWTYIGGPASNFITQIEMAKDVGVDFITFNVPNCWFSDEKGEDWLSAEYACQNIINANPKAMLIPRISMDAPSWWLQQNPDALMVFEDGSMGSKASISHRKYRADAACHLEKFCKHMVETFPDNFAGIHPSGQNTGEWFYDQSWGWNLSGYDTATLTAWQNYSGLAEVPPAFKRRIAEQGLLMDPVEDHDVILFNQFLQDEMADFLIQLSDAARRGLGDNKVILLFYGYHYELAAPINGPACTGHFALNKLLDSPNIDILTGPISYNDRGPGGGAANMSSVESILRAGKLWLNEDDTRTYLSTNLEDHARYGGCSTLEETQGVLLRNIAQSALRGYGSWWMDHGAGTAGGWFADTELWDVMDWSEQLDNDMIQQNRIFEPKVAAILGESSMLHIAGGSNLLGREFIYMSREALARCGTSYGQYTLYDDINKRVGSPLKLYLSAWALSESERETIIQNRQSNETRVWFYAPGYISGNECSLGFMDELTGFEFHHVGSSVGLANPTAEGRELGLISSWGYDTDIDPLFTIDPDSCVVLAKYANGRTAMAIKETDKGKDVFVGIPQITEELMGVLLRIAEITKITDDKTILSSHLNYTVIHATQDGQVDIAFDTSVQSIQDGISGTVIETGNDITLNLKKGETRVLKYAPNTVGISNNNMTSNTCILYPNYPNPFNPSTTISYSLNKTDDVKITIFDLRGRAIKTITNKAQKPGRYEISWNAALFPSGVYVLQLQTDNQYLHKKMLLVK